MKAALYTGKNSFAIGESERKNPGAGEVLLRVAYCGICGTDMHIFHGKMDARVKIPQPIGHEMSGVIEAVGDGVSGFAPGEKVVVRPLAYSTSEEDWGRDGAHIRPGLKFMGIDTIGAFQGYWTVPAYTLHRLPGDVEMDIAALCEPLAVACHDVRVAELKRGEHAVVIGGGPIGILIALVARQLGARVLVSEINPARLALLQMLGIDTINPCDADLEQAVMERTGGIGADVVFEVTATKSGAEVMTKLPCIRGRIVLVGIFSEPVPINLHSFFWKEAKMFGARVYEAQDFEDAIGYIADGSLPLRSLISRIAPLEEISSAFEEIASGADIVKTLIKCS